MDPGFGGFAVFIVVAVITGVIGYLAVQQSKIKREIEESRRQREREELASLGSLIPPTQISTPQSPPSTIPEIKPGGTPINLPPGQAPGLDDTAAPPPS